MKKTKIVCTLGPASDSVKKIISLIQAGMNVVRLNFSHGSYEHHKKIIENIREAEAKTGQRVGILQDLQGPKIRVGKLEELKVKKGEKIKLPLRTPEIIKYLKVGDKVMVNDGFTELKILKKLKESIECEVLTAGVIKEGNGINFPDSKIKIKTITDKDKKDLKFGLENGVDFIALSFVKDAKDIKNLKKLTKKNDVEIIAKIERHEAVKNLEEIIKEADGVMVARGDLGVDIPLEMVPIIQKRIILLSNKHAKPVITATEVLYSMIKKSRATRAEISDAANAVFDRTDAIMLSNETAIGKYPVKAAETLTKVSHIVEEEMAKHTELIENFSKKNSTINAVCLNACELAEDMKADYIVCLSHDGYTAKQIAKYRPWTPIITITDSEKTAKKLTLVWGLNRVFIKENLSLDITKTLKELKVVKKGDKIVTVIENNIASYKI